jgi:hypothetical protein
MERFSLDEDAAFRMLVTSSLDTNIKLTEVARRPTTEVAGRPSRRPAGPAAHVD